MMKMNWRRRQQRQTAATSLDCNIAASSFTECYAQYKTRQEMEAAPNENDDRCVLCAKHHHYWRWIDDLPRSRAGHASGVDRPSVGDVRMSSIWFEMVASQKDSWTNRSESTDHQDEDSRWFTQSRPFGNFVKGLRSASLDVFFFFEIRDIWNESQSAFRCCQGRFDATNDEKPSSRGDTFSN